MEYCNSL